MFIGGIKDRAMNLAAERILRNLGIEDIIENPKNYQLEFYVDNEDSITMKVKKNATRR